MGFSMSTIATIDLSQRLGVSPDRIRLSPAPGTATVEDVIEIQDHEGVLCELIDGTLVEKTVGLLESGLGIFLATLLDAFVRSRNLGIVTGEASTFELMPDLVRIPDVAFTSWDRLPGRCYPTDPIPAIAPNLAVEVLSRSNTPGEMALKRRDYFSAGVELVWEVAPTSRTIAVFTSPTQMRTLTIADVLGGGTVLPGFAVAVGDVFAELDRRG
jgi:Uma2 family endonuclease